VIYLFFITVSRQTGSYGYEIVRSLAERFGLEVITHDFVIKKWLPDVASKHELKMLSESPGYYLNQCSTDMSFAEYIKTKLQEIVEQQSVIIMGLGSQIIFSTNPEALHIRIIASHNVRIDRILHKHHLEKQDAERFLELTDRKHKRFINTIYGRDWSDPELYDITLNTDFLNIEESVSMVSYMAELKKAALLNPVNFKIREKTNTHTFKHQSEEEFSKILDMYNIKWEYEPRTFPIEWDAEGNTTKAFSPDFYLPHFDTFIEITTMEQKYVTEKKKKVRKVRELYPGTNINIVFKNDFYSLLKRFGLRGGVNSNE
jgi:cytidylate kinase